MKITLYSPPSLMSVLLRSLSILLMLALMPGIQISYAQDTEKQEPQLLPSLLTGCSVPGFGTSTVLSQSSARLNWAPVVNVSLYSVRYRAAGTGTWITRSAISPDMVLYGLQPQTLYEWQLKTLCGRSPLSESAYSQSYFFTTKNFCPVPSLVSIFPNFHSAQLNWTHNLGGQPHFEVRFRVKGAQLWTYRNFGNAYQGTLTGLYPGRFYEIQIRALCAETLIQNFQPVISLEHRALVRL